jgi:hypothetical protein
MKTSNGVMEHWSTGEVSPHRSFAHASITPTLHYSTFC